MPMPTKYRLKLARPTNKIKLTGTPAIMGQAIMIPGEAGAFVNTNLPANEVIGYWSPMGMYAIDSGRVPRSILQKTVVLQRTDTGECIYSRVASETHFSLFMHMTQDVHKANTILRADSSIATLHTIQATHQRPQQLLCYWNKWRSTFTENPYPEVAATICWGSQQATSTAKETNNKRKIDPPTPATQQTTSTTKRTKTSSSSPSNTPNPQLYHPDHTYTIVPANIINPTQPTMDQHLVTLAQELQDGDLLNFLQYP